MSSRDGCSFSFSAPVLARRSASLPPEDPVEMLDVMEPALQRDVCDFAIRRGQQVDGFLNTQFLQVITEFGAGNLAE